MATKATTSKPTPANAPASAARPIPETGQEAGAEKSGGSKKFVRRKEFVARVVASSGLKPNQVKTALDAVLQELGGALSNGEALQLPPLGKLSVNRQKPLKNGEVLVCKLRRPAPVQKIEPALADEAEEG